MSKFFLLLVIFVLLPVTTQAQTEDCDWDALRDYVETRREDVTAVQEVQQTEDISIPEYYAVVAATRQKYEDMTEVPECARELHRLMIAQLTSVQDGLFYTMFNNLSQEPIEEDENLQAVITRLTNLRTASEEEEARLQELLESSDN